MVQLHVIWLLFITCYLCLAFWIFLSETCYYLQKLVPFARCCTSRNFFICARKFWRKISWDVLQEREDDFNQYWRIFNHIVHYFKLFRSIVIVWNNFEQEHNLLNHFYHSESLWTISIISYNLQPFSDIFKDI